MKMQQQATIINDVFSTYGVACKVAAPPKSFAASTYFSFQVAREAGLKVSKVTALAPELDEALGKPIRFDAMPLSIEVQRSDPQRLSLLDLWPMLTQRTPAQGMPVVSGQGVSGGRLCPTLLNLAHPNTPHALVAGTTGSGKTSLLFSLILSAAAMRSPNELSIVALDPKAVDFRSLYGLPHLAAPVVTEPAECVAALRAVTKELERRKAAGMLDAKQKIVVVIDEVAELMATAGREVESYIQRIVSVGRGLGIHIVAATQKPTADIVGSVVKSNFPVRIVGKVPSNIDANVAAGISGTGAERLPGMGSFLIVNGNMHRVQSYYATSDEHQRMISQIARRWDTARPHYALRLDAEENKMATQSVSAEIESIAESGAGIPAWLVPSIRRYTEKNGKPPSQRKVQEAVQRREGKMLPWPVVKEAIMQAQRNGEKAKNGAQ